MTDNVEKMRALRQSLAMQAIAARISRLPQLATHRFYLRATVAHPAISRGREKEFSDVLDGFNQNQPQRRRADCLARPDAGGFRQGRRGMTVIVYRDGVLASDSLASRSGFRAAHTKKLFRARDGALLAICGYAGSGAAFVRWWEEGRDLGHKPTLDADNFCGLVVMPDGTFREYDPHLNWCDLEAPWQAYGAGREIAAGALAMGATAPMAVKIAIDLVDGCGGPIQVERLQPVLAEAAE